MSKYCCDMKNYCDRNPNNCPIAKRNKDICDFEKAKLSFQKSCLDMIIEKFEKFRTKYFIMHSSTFASDIGKQLFEMSTEIENKIRKEQ